MIDFRFTKARKYYDGFLHCCIETKHRLLGSAVPGKWDCGSGNDSRLQARVEPIVFQELESENSFNLGHLEKMKGYSNKYKIRVGDYRIGITADKKAKILTCERIAYRREIYKTFP